MRRRREVDCYVILVTTQRSFTSNADIGRRDFGRVVVRQGQAILDLPISVLRSQ